MSCPPNYLWQSWLESSFPGYTAATEPGTAQSIAQDPTVKSVTDKAAPALQALNDKTAPALQSLNEQTAPALKALNEKATAATTAIQDSEIVQTVKRRATEGVETVKAKAREFEARTGVAVPQSIGGKEGASKAQTFSSPSGETIEKTSERESKPKQSAKKLNIKNTAIKFSLDQTLGAAVNNVLFIAGIGALRGKSLADIVASVQSVS